MKSVQEQLEALGLGEKEVSVYLASLELGSSTVQQIAGKSGVVRASAYVAIGGLTKRGLMSSFTKGKKKYFTAEPPEQLLLLLKEKRKRLAEQEERLKQAMPELQALISLSVDRPDIKYYEGLEGLEAMREKIFESKAKEIRVIGIPNQLIRAVPDESRVIHNMRLKRARIKGKYIVVSASGTVPAPPIEFDNWEYRSIKKPKLSTGAEISAFSDYVTLISYQDKPYGFLIRSADITGLAKLLFDSAWANADENTWQ